jgi:hypothetical protein
MPILKKITYPPLDASAIQKKYADRVRKGKTAKDRAKKERRGSQA